MALTQVSTLGVKNATLKTEDLEDNAVTNAKIATQTIGGSKLVNNTITATQIAADTITGGLIADDAIDSEHYTDGSIDTVHIADLNITTGKLAANAVSTAKIADDAVTAAKLADDAVVTASIANNAVTTDKITDANITSGKLAAGAVLTTKIANDAVTGDKIADNAITAAHIAADTIIAADIAANAITASELADDAVDTAAIADSAVTTAKLATGATITNATNAAHVSVADNENTNENNLIPFIEDASATGNVGLESDGDFHYNPSTGAVTATKFIGDGSSLSGLDTASLSDGSVTTAKLAADAVTGAKIADDAIGSEHIEVLDAALQFGDSVKAQFGTGNDLEISHDGTDSRIANSTGNLIISDTNGLIALQGKAGEESVKCAADGTVELYYDNSKKLETTSYGAEVTGRLNVSNLRIPDYDASSDLGQIRVGNNNDLLIYHDGSNSHIHQDGTGDLQIRSDNSIEFNTNGTENAIWCDANAGVKLYYDTSLKLQTTSNGVKLGDSVKAEFGSSGEATIYHDGSNTYFKGDANAGLMSIQGQGNVELFAWEDILLRVNAGESGIKINNNQGVEAFYNDVKKFETTAAGANVIGNLDVSGDFKLNSATNAGQDIDWDESAGTLTCQDNVKLYFGAAGDLCIYHDGSNSYIDEGDTGSLILRASPSVELRKAGSTEKMLYAEPDAQVELYYDNSKKFETYTNGTIVTGNLSVTGNSGTGLMHGDNVKAVFGGGDDLQIYYDGTDGYIRNHVGGQIVCRANTNFLVQTNASDGGADNAIKALNNAAVELYYDNAKKWETTSYGTLMEANTRADFHGNIKLYDDCIIYIGTGNDLQITHDGTNSLITNATGWLKILDTSSGGGIQSASNEHQWNNQANDEAILAGYENGAVKLYYDAAVKLETTAAGIQSADDLRLVTATDTTSRITALASGTYTVGSSGGSAIGFHRFSDSGGASDEIFFENHYQGVRHGETLRIDKNGDLKLSDGTSRAQLTCTHSDATSATNRVGFHSNGCGIYHSSNGNATDHAFEVWSSYAGAAGSSSANEIFRIEADGDTLNDTDSFGSLSDIKLKQDITDATSQWDDIKAIKFKNFKFKNHVETLGADKARKLLGVIAQDLEDAGMNGLVKDNPDVIDGVDQGTVTKSVRYSILTLKAVKALQEAMAKIETLEAKVAALEAG